MKTLKNEKTDNKSKRRACKKKCEISGEKVLLNYTYYLDECQNRKVMLGFDPLTFQAKIVFHLHGRFPVSAFYTAWVALYNHLKKLKSELNDDNLPLNQETLKKQHKIPVDNGSITLQQQELYKLLDMTEFLNIVMYHNNNASGNVKEYYTKYIQKCKEKNVIKLADEDFFIPAHTSYVHINYSRLFYEIPMFYSGNIIFDMFVLE